MAYPVVTDACLDLQHQACVRHSEPPADPEVVGGWFCICPCHYDSPGHNEAWFNEVKQYSIEARARGHSH